MVLIDAHRPTVDGARVADPRDGSVGGRVWSIRTVIGLLVLTGVGAVLLARWLTGAGYVPAPSGLPDAGMMTSTLLPIVGLGQEIAGIAVVGLLVIRLLLTWRRVTDVDLGDRLSGAAVRWAWVWVATAALLTVLTLSDLAGAPVTSLPADRDTVLLLLGTDRVLSVTATLWTAALLVMFARRFQGRVGTAVLLAIAAGGLLPQALTGHVAHHNQDITLATIALGVHVVAASVWVGGLLALIVHLRRAPAALAAVLPWFSAIALGCVLAVGLTGVVASVVMLDGWAALWASPRGWLTMAKAAALAGLIVIGWWHRRRTVGAAVDGRLAPLLRLGAVELALMSATVGVAIVLSNAA